MDSNDYQRAENSVTMDRNTAHHHLNNACYQTNISQAIVWAAWMISKAALLIAFYAFNQKKGA